MKNPRHVPKRSAGHLNMARPSETADVVRHPCSREKYAHKWQLAELVSEMSSMNWPIDSQKLDLYINEKGMIELLILSQQPEAKDFRRHCCNVLFPHVR